MMLRSIAFATLLIAPPWAAFAQQNSSIAAGSDGHEQLTTYASQRGSTAAVCEATCMRDAKCTGWALTLPTFRVGPRCELKQAEVYRAASQPPRQERILSDIPARPKVQQPAPPPASIRQVQPAAVGPETQNPQPASAETATQIIEANRQSDRPRQTDPGRSQQIVESTLRGTTPTSSSAAPVRVPVPTPQPVQRTRTVVTTPPRTVTTARALAPKTASPATPPNAAPAPPPLIARPSAAATRSATTSPAEPPFPVSPVPPASDVRPPRAGPEAAPAALDEKQPLPARTSAASRQPLPSLGADDRPPLPRRRLNDGQAYSVQKMEILPGDLEATAGYLETLPDQDEAEVSGETGSEN
ncbi:MULTISPECIES: hypothetical protein [Henriciella]|uniref:Apple domain-containing protein n=1 Tax=Henriciella pelagia TaxID=1977912 RepID=A0ABQ1JH38_9PROT|nr:hypothetical protein [Henriciella pelagia]GGB66150.1 hypothetical protein GCM10011503_13680 [Henriciella pelagia]